MPERTTAEERRQWVKELADTEAEWIGFFGNHLTFPKAAWEVVSHLIADLDARDQEESAAVKACRSIVSEANMQIDADNPDDWHSVEIGKSAIEACIAAASSAANHMEEQKS